MSKHSSNFLHLPFPSIRTSNSLSLFDVSYPSPPGYPPLNPPPPPSNRLHPATPPGGSGGRRGAAPPTAFYEDELFITDNNKEVQDLTTRS